MLTDRPFGSLIREDKPTKDLWGILDRHAKPITFDAIRIKLAAPQTIRDWSHGEVKKTDLVAVDKARKLQDEHGAESLKVGMGAEAIRELLRDMDLDSLARDLRAQMLGETSVQKRKKIVKRLKVIEAFLKSGNQPDWMILEV